MGVFDRSDLIEQQAVIVIIDEKNKTIYECLVNLDLRGYLHCGTAQKGEQTYGSSTPTTPACAY